MASLHHVPLPLRGAPLGRARRHALAPSARCAPRALGVVAVTSSSSAPPPAPSERAAAHPVARTTRRESMAHLASLVAVAALPLPAQAAADPGGSIQGDFVELPSGLRVLTIKEGTGPAIQKGDTALVCWTGVTSGYRQHRIDDPTVKGDREPYAFVLGDHQVIPAFEEAVGMMKVGGVVRVEVLGKHPELGYPADRKERFTDGANLKYRYGPQPTDLGGQRALDFVLDSNVLQDFNKDLVFDIRLDRIRKA